LGAGATAGAGLIGGAVWPGRVHSGTPKRMPTSKLPKPYSVPFARPPLAVPARMDDTTDYHRIVMAPIRAEVLPGFWTTQWAYNGSVPGATIRARRGRRVVARFVNELPFFHPTLGYEAYTSIHLHGGFSKPQYDGYASDIIHPGQYKDYVWDNTECARPLWFHDHAVHHTWSNVYMGLAAQYWIDDPADDVFGLPRGEYEVPLHFSDALFQEDGELYLHLDDLKGLWGDVMLVNGRPWPAMTVRRRKYRFRMVNGCVSRTLFWRLSTGDPVTVVGTDGGLMPYPVSVTRVRHVNGERYDVVIDFSKYTPGTRVELRNDSLPYNEDDANTDRIMAFDVVDEPFDPSNNEVPSELVIDNPVMTRPRSDAKRVRNLRTKRQGGEWTVNGHTWHDVIDSQFRLVEGSPLLGATEIWEYQNNSGGWSHPMHTHGVDARLLTRNGKPPYAYEVGPKDTFHVGENETLRILVTFELPGKYQIHCHNGVHEDHDMMSQYQTVDPAGPAPDPFSAPAKPLPDPPL
jgi:spore coat protein A, manganese oxidase